MRIMDKFICIECPNGCELAAEITEGGVSVSGNRCARGAAYAQSELLRPERTLCSVVGVDGGERPVLPVRTSAPIPKARVFDLMKLLKKTRITAPVRVGDVIIENILGLEVDIIATDDLRAIRN